MDFQAGEYEIKNISKVNLIIGKNGAGKSQILRSIDLYCRGDRENFGHVKYISPERGGYIIADAGVEGTLREPNWVENQLHRNGVNNFRQISVAVFRELELRMLKKIEKDPSIRASAFTFDDTVGEINKLLDNIKVSRDERQVLKIWGIAGDERGSRETLSSGESELIALAIEIIAFFERSKEADCAHKENILLLDEPDAHLHPDLQTRLIALIEKCLRDAPAKVIIATHSTAFLGGFIHNIPNWAVVTRGSLNIAFKPIDIVTRDILPIFGAHPLSAVFNKNPILIVEGEDDVRIWQQVVRSSRGKIKFWPCSCGSVDSMNTYEVQANQILSAVYDTALGFSIRDRDDGEYKIDDFSAIRRAKLNCYSAENLILTNECLSALGVSWDEMKTKIKRWCENSRDHPQYDEMMEFVAQFDRQNAKVKSLRNLFLAIAGSHKPWEILVGQEIAKLSDEGNFLAGSLKEFLGAKILDMLESFTDILAPEK